MHRVKPWRERACELLLDCPIFDVEKVTAESPVDGTTHDFVRLRSADWVQIVPVTRAGEIVMVRQHRHGSGKVVLEIPAGMIDPGEAPASAAVRECLEETGYCASDVQAMGSINPNPAFMGNRLYAFYSNDVERVGDVQDTATEQTEVVLVPKREVIDLLRRNEIDHALVAVTLWRYLHQYDEIAR